MDNDNPSSHVSTRQPKYHHAFQEDLAKSQEMVLKVQRWFNLHYPFIILRTEDDKNPYVDASGNEVRFVDIDAYNPQNGKHLYIECKDFCRMVFYDLTGLPRQLLEKYLKFASDRPLLMLFQDNPTFLEQFAKEARKCGGRIEEAKRILVEEGTLTPEGEFIPYGGLLSELMLEENRKPYKENERYTDGSLVIPCKMMGRYYMHQQYLFRLSSMKALPEAVKGLLV